MSCWSPSTKANSSPLPPVTLDSPFLHCCVEYVRKEQLMQTYLFPKTYLDLITWKPFLFFIKCLDKSNKENLRRMTNYSSCPNVTFKNNLIMNPLFVKNPYLGSS